MSKIIPKPENLASLILLLRGEKVLLDSDLALLYGVEARALNQAVKRNLKRFPADFMFQLTPAEAENVGRLRSQIVTLKPHTAANSSQFVMSSGKHRGRSYRPYAFTEQGVAMLSSVLRSSRAVEVNIAIMRTFVQLRRLMDSNRGLARKIEALEKKYDENVSRLGRKTKIPKKQQAILWSIFQKVREKLVARGLITHAALFTKLATAIAEEKSVPFDFAVVDEAQDLTVAHLRFFATLGRNQPNSLFFAGDLGQRIFQQPFSWIELGVDIRGRSQNLTVNYRTSHQIRTQSDRLLAAELSDLDGNLQDRSGTVSVFNGPVPIVKLFKNEQEEIDGVSEWISERMKEGVVPHEFAIFVRSAGQIPRARAAIEKAKISFKILDEKIEPAGNNASISTMHLAKGLEFRAVVVMACDDEVIPLQDRIETIGDHADLQEVYDTERHLLYVACTRARDHLLVTGVKPASEFLEDLQSQTLIR
jgi:superfamily I DNA/RNA helicase